MVPTESVPGRRRWSDSTLGRSVGRSGGTSVASGGKSGEKNNLAYIRDGGGILVGVVVVALAREREACVSLSLRRIRVGTVDTEHG